MLCYIVICYAKVSYVNMNKQNNTLCVSLKLDLDVDQFGEGFWRQPGLTLEPEARLIVETILR